MVAKSILGIAIKASQILEAEKEAIEKHYSFANCVIRGSELICHGYYTPTNVRYDYILRYDGETAPQVHVINPIISYNDDIHMYFHNNSLCLYYPPEDPWKPFLSTVWQKMIPWTHEWFVFYEKYLISGIWEHPFVNHKLL